MSEKNEIINEFENSAEETANENVTKEVVKQKKPRKPRAKKTTIVNDDAVNEEIKAQESVNVNEEIKTQESVSQEIIEDEIIEDEIIEDDVINDAVNDAVNDEVVVDEKEWFKYELLKGSYEIYQNGIFITSAINGEIIHIADTYFQVNNKKYSYKGLEIRIK